MYRLVLVLFVFFSTSTLSQTDECCRAGFDDFDCVLGSSCNNITKKCACRTMLCRQKCPYGFKIGEDGCQLCECATKKNALKIPTECPGVRCGLVCKNGYRKNIRGCKVCRCKIKARECVYDTNNKAVNFPCTNVYDPSKCRPRYDEFDCKEGKSCNFNTKTCTCGEVQCRVLCEHGYLYGPDGCAKCQCASRPLTVAIKTCAGVRCGLQCPLGFQKNQKGCDICRCKQPIRSSECRPRYDWYDCQSNKSCNSHTKKCSCPTVDCRIHCKYGYKFGTDGCAVCECASKEEGFDQLTEACEKMRCGLNCPHGFVRNAMGCQICRCLPRPSSVNSLLSRCIYENQNQAKNYPCFEGKSSATCRPRYHEFDCQLGSSCNSKTTKCQCKEVVCDFCVFGYLPDKYGCPTCVCAHKTSGLGEVVAGCPRVNCGLKCPDEYKTNHQGCPICRCVSNSFYE